MYCNNCLKQIAVDEITYCSECGVPLHKKCANHCLECGKDMCDECYIENNYRCTDCVNEKKNLKSIRRSYLKQYEDCPHSLYLQLMENIVPPMSSYAEVGIIVHDVIEKMQLKEINGIEAKNEFIDRVNKWNIETKDEYSLIPLKLQEVGLNSIDVFCTILPSFNDDFKTEYKIEYSLGRQIPKINCTLDRISFQNGEIHIHDWKTGKPMSGKKLVEDLQPPVYIYGVYKEFKQLPKTFTLHYLNAEKNITYKHKEGMIYEVKTARNTYELDVEKEMERVKKILKNIKLHNFDVEEGKSMWRCSKMCWYYTSGTCKKQEDIAEEFKKVNEEREVASN